MTLKTAILACLFLLSSCQQLTSGHQQEKHLSQDIVNSCPVTADAVLSCIASSQQLSAQGVNTEFDSIPGSMESKKDNNKLNRLLCLSLHRHASKEQLEKGKTLLKDILKKDHCQQQNLTGLLLIIQGNIQLHKKYLNQNWKLHLENKEISSKKETIKQEFDQEAISYQRRIQDLEQQVQKLKEIESLLDKNMRR